MTDRTNQDEHDTDPRDWADGLYLMDDGEVTVVPDEPLPYPLHEEAPQSMRNYRPAMRRQWRDER
jgi:hypothetical protein